MAQAVIGLLADRLMRVVVVTKQRGCALASTECPTYPYRSRSPVAQSQRTAQHFTAHAHRCLRQRGCIGAARYAGISMAALRAVNEALRAWHYQPLSQKPSHTKRGQHHLPSHVFRCLLPEHIIGQQLPASHHALIADHGRVAYGRLTSSGVSLAARASKSWRDKRGAARCSFTQRISSHTCSRSRR